MRRRPGLVAVLLTGALVALGACGNGANSVAVCQQLENERCQRAPACGVDLTYPLHDPSISAVDSCTLFYQDACLHGLVTSLTPTGPQVNACLTAIKTSCSAMIAPQTNPACSWLIPPDAGVDAGHDAGVVDVGAPEVIVVVVMPDAGVDAAEASTCDETCESECVDNAACITACGC